MSFVSDISRRAIGGGRGWLFLGLILLELAVFRELSAGRFLLLSTAGDDVSWLLALHTSTKVSLSAGMALIFVTIVERRFAGDPAIPETWLKVLVALHAAVFVVFLLLLSGLPQGGQAGPLEAGLQRRYALVSAVFLAWQLSGFLILAPARCLRGLKATSVLFVVAVMGAALILSMNEGALLSAIGGSLETATLVLSLAIYGVFGRAVPDVFTYEGLPIVQVGDFAVQVGTACAGYQGMLASATIMGALVLLEWSSLRKARALLLAVTTVGVVFLMNSVRIAILLHIGEAYSEEVAVNGFHSYFGTLSLLAIIALAMLLLQLPAFRSAEAARRGTSRLEQIRGAWGQAGPDRLLADAAPYLLPLAAYLCVVMIVGLFGTGFNWLYPVSALIGFGILFACRRMIRAEFADGVGPGAFAMGVLVFVFWLMLIPPDPDADRLFNDTLGAAPALAVTAWVLMRALGSSIVVPVLEELAFRAGLMRLLSGLLEPISGRMPAVAVSVLGSSFAFGLLHSNLWAGVMAGIGYAILTLRTGRVGDAIVAHAVTNFLIALTAIGIERWSLW
ncbi:exosortase E/protease, VPEID-CTERM system [Rhodobacterales bacterium HKCCSP123]|nr:exosortase E/protease, VPEID-CTERM system [Rhodobacterales bacterium HKCCSP123]